MNKERLCGGGGFSLSQGERAGVRASFFHCSPSYGLVSKLVILNGCETYGDIWSRTFGVDFSQQMSTNYVLLYNAIGRVPRAYVGWTKQNYVPSSLDFTGVDHAEFGLALGGLFSDWMAGFRA